ncbi:hypothetical protein [Shewanella ulleungensis]|uniref:hypothetical protein n=1 Tax=Shewanella ulleungensis TaxID=2282699 RepID=UPI003D78BA36
MNTNISKPTHKSLHFSVLSFAILSSFYANAENYERDPLLKIQEVIVVKGQSVSAVEASMALHPEAGYFALAAIMLFNPA